MKEGFIYIVSNNNFPGFYKIGVTEDITARLGVYQTSDPNRKYKIEHYLFHPLAYKAEKKIHEAMKYFAMSKHNEWFEISLSIAISRLEETLDDYNECPEKY